MAHPAVDASQRFRNALMAKEATAAGRMVRAYGRIYQDVNSEIDDLLKGLWDEGEGKYRESVKLTRLRALEKQIADEIGRYGAYADTEMLEGSRDAIAAALNDSRALTQLALPEGLQQAGIMGQWHRLPAEAVEQMLGFLGPDSPLHDALVKELGGEVAERVGQAMTKGIALGWNPRKVAAYITKQFGAGLTWSMRTVRTAQLWSYREATRASYLANPRIVKGWTWSAAIDTRTCMSCLAMDGTHHPSTEVLNDHHNGRCAMLPDTVTYRDLGLDVDTPPLETESGRDWFERQPESVQKQMMGKGMWDKWQGGAFEFADLTQPYDDTVYGEMRRQATLKELIPDGN